MQPSLPAHCSIRISPPLPRSPGRNPRRQGSGTTSIATTSPSVSSTLWRRYFRRHCVSPGEISSGRWRASMCAPHRRPHRCCSSMDTTFPTSSNSTNMRNQCHGWRMWRGSSGHGSTHTRLDAYHAADIQPLMPHALASIPPEQLAGTVLKPHPAARIVRSRFPAVTIFTTNRDDSSASRVEVVEAEDALLTRPALEVEVRRLPPGGAIFLTRLMAGESLGASASAAVSDTPSFDLAANISGMLEAGAFTTALYGESR